MSNDVGGFAIRRTGNCLRLEEHCGTVQHPFRACCAQDTVCNKSKSTPNIYVRAPSPTNTSVPIPALTNRPSM